MKKMLKIILIAAAVIVLVLVLAVVGLALLANYRSDHYYQYATPAGGWRRNTPLWGPMRLPTPPLRHRTRRGGAMRCGIPPGWRTAARTGPW